MEPITRKEKFFASAVSQDVNPPDPVTREEMYLKQIVDLLRSGGVGNKVIAHITYDDDDNPVCDKSLDEIETAISSAIDEGKIGDVALDYYGIGLTFNGNEIGKYATFSGMHFAPPTQIMSVTATIRNNGTVELTEGFYDLSSLKMG